MYVGFALAVIFCILNAFQGVFIFIWSVLLRKLQLKHITKIKYEKTSSSGATETSNTDNQYYRKEESTEITNLSEDIKYSPNSLVDKSENFELKSELKYREDDIGLDSEHNKKPPKTIHNYENILDDLTTSNSDKIVVMLKV